MLARHLFYFLIPPFPIFVAGYDSAKNKVGKKNIQRILFENPNHIQTNVHQRNIFEFRSGLLFS